MKIYHLPKANEMTIGNAHLLVSTVRIILLLIQHTLTVVEGRRSVRHYSSLYNVV